MKKITFLITLVLSLGLFGAVSSTGHVAAFDPFGKLKDPNNGVCSANPEANQSAVCTEDGQANPLSGSNGVILKATDLIAVFGGIAAVIMIIVGGLQYILSTGDSSRTNSAKNTILYALVGLVVIILARTLIAYVINKL